MHYINDEMLQIHDNLARSTEASIQAQPPRLGRL